MARRATIGAALLVFVGARLTAFPEPLGIDQGIFATAGWGMTRGLVLYRDLWDQKPPGIHLLYAAAIALFGPHPWVTVLLDTAAWTMAIVLVALIANRLSTPRTASAAAGVLAIATFPSFAYAYGGFLERAVPETFIAPLAAFAVWATLGRRYWLAGLAIGVATVFKPTALIYWPACVVAAVLAGERVKPAVGRIAATVALPWLVVALGLWSAGALAEARIAIVEYNVGYVAAGSGPIALPLRMAHEIWRLVKSDPAWLLASAGTIAAAVAWRRRGERASTVLPALAIVWLAAVMLAVASNGIRMYSTYFLPAAPPVALLAGWFIAEHARGRRAIVVGLVLLAAVAVAWQSHAPHRAVRYIAADIRRMRGTLPREPYLDLFSSRNPRGYSARANANLVDYLRAHAASSDRLYLFGMAPAVYFETGLLPANRFLWTYPAVAPFMHEPGFGVDALASALTRAAPSWLVFEPNDRDTTGQWRTASASASIRGLLQGYRPTIVIEPFTVLHRGVQ